MKIYVRTTEERVLDDSYKQIKYELLVDNNHQPVQSFIEQLNIISGDDSLLLEDDLILCKDFLINIKKAIEEYPNKIINFFFKPKEYFTTFESEMFSYNQCTYYPKGISKKIATEMLKIRTYNPNMQYDILEYRAMINLSMTNVIYRPCLVQHIDYSSLIQVCKHYMPRRTPYYIDYINELGIKYEDAYRYKRELYKLLNEKFSSDIGTK